MPPDDWDRGYAAGFDSAEETYRPKDERPLTLERVKQMTTEEINADWDRVQAVLKGSG